MHALRSLGAVLVYIITYFAIAIGVRMVVLILSLTTYGAWFDIVSALAALVAGIAGVAIGKLFIDTLFFPYSKLEVAVAFTLIVVTAYVWAWIANPNALTEFGADYINGLLRDAFACLLTWAAFFRNRKVPA